MLSYNHEKFIVQAVESALAQRGEFDLDIVIGDDASKDATPALLQDLQSRFPGQVKLRLNTANIGMMQNLQATLADCTGDYIAMLEGDDYWTDPDKLHKQLAVMQAHPDAAICFHPVQILEGDRFVEDRFTKEVPAITSIADLAQGNYMHTCSVMYRAGLVAQLPASFANSTVGDYFLHMLYAQHGSIHKLPDVMAVYRVHSGGVWSSHKNIEKKVLQYLSCMIGCFDEPINATMIKRYNSIAVRVFMNELGSDADAANFERCLAYDNAPLLKALATLAQENAQHKKSFLARATRVVASLGGAR
jgi:glycosyltransferase involved in cell wall biosynthesis